MSNFKSIEGFFFTFRHRKLVNEILKYALCLLCVEIVVIVLLFALAFVPQALALKAAGWVPWLAWLVALLLTLIEVLVAVLITFAAFPVGDLQLLTWQCKADAGDAVAAALVDRAKRNELQCCAECSQDILFLFFQILIAVLTLVIF